MLCREALHAAVQKNWLPEAGRKMDRWQAVVWKKEMGRKTTYILIAMNLDDATEILRLLFFFVKGFEGCV